MDPKKLTIDGRDFHMRPLRPMQVLKISKKIVSLIGAGMKGGTKQQIVSAVATAMDSMSEDEFEMFCLQVLSTVDAATKDGFQNMGTVEGFDAALMDIGIENVLVLLYDVMRYNRFPLLRDLGEDLDIGNLIKEISLSLKEEVTSSPNEESMEPQENSQKS